MLTKKKKKKDNFPIRNQCSSKTWLNLEQPVQLEYAYDMPESSPNLRQNLRLLDFVTSKNATPAHWAQPRCICSVGRSEMSLWCLWLQLTHTAQSRPCRLAPCSALHPCCNFALALQGPLKATLETQIL